MDYAIAHGAQVVNGGYGDGEDHPGEREAMRRLMEAGIIFVNAVGNEGHDIDIVPLFSLCCYDNIIGVAATTAMDELAWWTNYNRWATRIAAPGEDIFSCGLAASEPLKTLRDLHGSAFCYRGLGLVGRAPDLNPVRLFNGSCKVVMSFQVLLKRSSLGPFKSRCLVSFLR